MPTLTRFVRTIALVVGLVYGAMLALAFLVEPRVRTMSEPVETRILREAPPVSPPAVPAAPVPDQEEGDA